MSLSIVGGILVETVGWRGIFWVNLPVGVAAIILTALFVPESRAPRARPFDPVGQVLVIITLAALTYGIIEGPGSGWTSAVDEGAGAGAGGAPGIMPGMASAGGKSGYGMAGPRYGVKPKVMPKQVFV